MQFEIQNYSIDAKKLIEILQKKYNISIINLNELKEIQRLIKLEFKEKDTFTAFCQYTKFPVFDLIVTLQEIFPRMFTSKIILKLNDYLMQRALQENAVFDPRKAIRNLASRDKFL